MIINNYFRKNMISIISGFEKKKKKKKEPVGYINESR